MTRPTVRLDTALLARRLWLAQIAEVRRCSLAEAEHWDTCRQERRRFLRWAAVGFVFTILLYLVGLP